MKDYITYQLMNEMGAASPLCSYVYITVNGEDWGLYLAVEAVEDSFLQRNYGNEGGELYKPDSMGLGGGRENGKDFDMDKFMDNFDGMKGFEEFSGQMSNFGGGFGMGSSDVKLQYTDAHLDSYSNIFNNAKTDITKADKERLIKALRKLTNGEDIEDTVAIEEVIRYFVVHNFVLNGDSYTGSMIHNYYLYENDGQMQMIPWDYNLAFGTFQGGGNATSVVNSPIDSPVDGDMSDRPMIAWIFHDQEYTELYHTIFAEFINGCFESGYFENMLDTVKEMIAPYVEKDPTKFCTYEEFEKGVEALKEFCLLRSESVRKQLNGEIGLTSDTQDSSTFVNADNLQISDMGSMGKSMGDAPSFPNGKSEMNMGQNHDNREPKKFDRNMQNFNGNPQRNEASSRYNNANLTLLVVCVGILAVGLVITTVYTRRKK